MGAANTWGIMAAPAFWILDITLPGSCVGPIRLRKLLTWSYDASITIQIVAITLDPFCHHVYLCQTIS